MVNERVVCMAKLQRKGNGVGLPSEQGWKTVLGERSGLEWAMWMDRRTQIS